MKIAIGCDPNAEEAKKEIIAYIEKKGYGEVTDFGSEDPVYANVAIDVAEHVASGEYDRGVLICGTGLGVSIAANKVKGAYAALVSDVYSATRATHLFQMYLRLEDLHPECSKPEQPVC